MKSPHIVLCALFSLGSAILAADPDPALDPWRKGVNVHPVALDQTRHSIHAYFNTCPESPDGKYVLYYTSNTSAGEEGDIRILERATGKETIVATGIVTEDAHRAACQQWSNGGKTVVYHNYKDKQWQVVAFDVASRETKVLAADRQKGFGSATGAWIPVYGCHWNPGPHRDLELIHVVTGEIKKAVEAKDVVKEYGNWISERFKSTDISIFFPVMSPDESKVFFKLSKPGGGTDFRSKAASQRDGKVVYDLAKHRFLRLMEFWGHPSWSPDSKSIFEYGNFATDVVTGESKRYARSCISDHPSIAPEGRLFVTDADVTKRQLRNPGDWAVAIGSMKADEWTAIHLFDNTKGATTWRHNHPHPNFSADGKRVYFNTNSGPWTTLMVAESAQE